MKKNIFLFLIFFCGHIYSQQLPNLGFKLDSGKLISLNELVDNGPLLINFWALWCSPCLKELPHLNQLHKKYKDKGFKVLAINVDTEKPISQIRSYIKRNSLEMLSSIEPNLRSFKKLNGKAMPYTILINSSNKVIYKHNGYVLGDEIILEKLILNYFSK